MSELILHAELDDRLSTSDLPGHQAHIAAEPLGLLLKRLVFRPTSNIPHLDHLVRGLDCNSARVILIVQFALACIHRRTSLESSPAPSVAALNLALDGFWAPFCGTRREPARPNGAAHRAAATLAALAPRLIHGRLKSLTISDSHTEPIPKYNFASEWMLSKAIHLIDGLGSANFASRNDAQAKATQFHELFSQQTRRLAEVEQQLGDTEGKLRKTDRALPELGSLEKVFRGPFEDLKEQTARALDLLDEIRVELRKKAGWFAWLRNGLTFLRQIVARRDHR